MGPYEQRDTEIRFRGKYNPKLMFNPKRTLVISKQEAKPDWELEPKLNAKTKNSRQDKLNVSKSRIILSIKTRKLQDSKSKIILSTKTRNLKVLKSKIIQSVRTEI